MDAWLKRYGNDSVAAHMQAGFILLRSTMTIGEFRKKLREGTVQRHESSDSKTEYFYVEDDTHKLCGVLSLAALTKAYDQELIADVMNRDVFTLKKTELVEPSVKMLYLSTLRALPVVEDGVLIGVFSLDYLVASIKMPAMEKTRDGAIKALREDLTRLLGFDQSAIRQASVICAYRLRAPWLAVTTLAGLLCARLIGQFDELLRAFPIVAAFLPLVLAIAESICHQASSLAIVEHLGARRNWRKLFSALSKEARVSLAIGLTYGCLVALGYGCSGGPWSIALVVGVSLVIAGAAGGILGLTVTTIMRLCRMNPHVAGGPIALAATDAMAVLIFLKVAHRLLL